MRTSPPPLRPEGRCIFLWRLPRCRGRSPANMIRTCVPLAIAPLRSGPQGRFRLRIASTVRVSPYSSGISMFPIPSAEGNRYFAERTRVDGCEGPGPQKNGPSPARASIAGLHSSNAKKLGGAWSGCGLQLEGDSDAAAPINFPIGVSSMLGLRLSRRGSIRRRARQRGPRCRSALPAPLPRRCRFPMQPLPPVSLASASPSIAIAAPPRFRPPTFHHACCPRASPRFVVVLEPGAHGALRGLRVAKTRHFWCSRTRSLPCCRRTMPLPPISLRKARTQAFDPEQPGTQLLRGTPSPRPQ